MIRAILLAVLLLPSASLAGQPESYYQNQWCADQGGQVEYILPDKTRVDCLSNSNAVEMDFARKWYEAVGQSLFYSMQTGKRAGIVLIIESEKDYKYWTRLNTTIEHFNLPVDTWKIIGY